MNIEDEIQNDFPEHPLRYVVPFEMRDSPGCFCGLVIGGVLLGVAMALLC